MERKLDNGLTVLLRPVEGAKQVAVVTLFSIGNDHDPQGMCGLAHLVEHLYSCCAAGDTQPRTVEQFMRLYPAGWNACTGDDFTVYATVCPRPSLAGELADAAARMGDLKVTGAEVDREKRRLTAEVQNMFGGIPSLAAMNLARQQVRPGAQGARRGGLPEQVNSITLADIQHRVKLYYKPRNAIVVVAGGFDIDQTRPLVERLFGKLPPGEPVPAPRPLHDPALGKTLTVKVKPNQPGQTPQVRIAYPAPRPDDPLYPSFLILVTRLVVAQAASGPAAAHRVNFAPLDDPAVLSIGAAPQAREEPQATVERLIALVARLAEDPLRPVDVQSTLNGLGNLLGLSDLPDSVWAGNPYGLAFSFGRRHQMGFDAGKIRKAVEATTLENLRKAAGELFDAKRRVAVIVQQGD